MTKDKKERVAVIDLGTNTFNLLIADISPGQMEEIYFEKIPVKLGQGGITHGMITQEARERALKSLQYYKQVTREYHVQEMLAYGTAALRSAGNSSSLTSEIKKQTGIEVRIISGEEEARLIYAGVIHSLHPDRPFLIMDVGGGSVEFILAEQSRGIRWIHSFPLGVTRLIEQFQFSDPVTLEDIHLLEKYLEDKLTDLWQVSEQYRPGILVGAAGTFDTLRALTAKKGLIPEITASHEEIPFEAYQTIHKSLLESNADERKKMKGMEPFRIELIVPASIFINFVLRKTGISTMIQSYYSLKEGTLFQWMEKRHYNG